MDAIQSVQMKKRVAVLGAGFSHAISAQIPLTDELGTVAIKKLDGPDLHILAMADLLSSGVMRQFPGRFH
jgi:hypothetical protein